MFIPLLAKMKKFIEVTDKMNLFTEDYLRASKISSELFLFKIK